MNAAEELVAMLRPMLKNPNAIDAHDRIVYLFTSDGRSVSVEISAEIKNF